jgi:hypothetical protein
MEKTIEFFIDGVLNGSATLFIADGDMDISNAEEKFYKVLRSDRTKLLEEEREYTIDNLTHEQEEKLEEAHAKDYHGTDDDMSDAYENWLMDLPLEDLKRILA